MDNNQQGKEGGVQQPASATPVTEQAGPNGGLNTDAKTDLGINAPSKANVGSPFTGKDVSMTTPQYAGGNIATTEAGSHA
jgi:hypothetical protein